MKTVRIFCIRHGQKDGDALTPLGERQVAAAAKMNLAGIDFSNGGRHVAYASEMTRAQQTAKVALGAIGCDCSVFQNPGFGYQWAMKLPGGDSFGAVEKELGPNATVTDWLKAWVPAGAILGRFFGTMNGLVDIALDIEGDEVNFLVASHSPTCELAAALVDPNFPRLGLADIVVYTFEAKDDDITMVSAEHLPCPPVD